MDYDPDDLRQVQRLRAVLDPIPLHPHGDHIAEHGSNDGTLSPQAVVTARLNQVEAQDDPSPIDQAPWPEAMLCVRSTFNDARFATSPQWVGVVKYTFRQYLASRNLDPDAMVPDHFFEGPVLPADADPNEQAPSEVSVYDLQNADDVQWMGITDTHREKANAFRCRIKHARDRVFLDEVYDHLQEVADLEFDVPKLVWKDAALETSADEDADTAPADDADDASTQTGLDMF